MLLCQNCQKNVAKVHVTEILTPEVHETPETPKTLGAAETPESGAAPEATGSAAAEGPAQTKSHADDDSAAEEAPLGYQEQHLCEVCAESMDLPSTPTLKKSTQEIWKLLHMAAQQTRKKSGPACPDCGMTLDEFRKKGRLGCAKDYEVFKQHILEILERVHGARRHVGRLPQGTSAVVATTQGEDQGRLVELRRELESAIRDEAYERAAHLRDAIKALEGTSSNS